MRLNRERSTCFGRGFSEVDSFLSNFVRWVAAPAEAVPVPKVSGGAGWYIIDDQRAATVPYIVISINTRADVVASPNKFDNPHMILKVEQSTTNGRVDIRGYLWWDVDTHIGYGNWYYGYVETSDDSNFAYDLRGGSDYMMINTNAGTGWTTCGIFKWEGDLRYVDGPTVAAETTNAFGSGSNVWVTFATQVEAENFELGKWYYIYDFNKSTSMNYTLVSAVDYANKRVRFTAITASFKIKSVVTSYAHRYFGYRNRPGSSFSYTLPYFSVKFGNSTDVLSTANNKQCSFGINSELLRKPDDEDRVPLQKPYIAEGSSTSGFSTNYNRMYGVPDAYISRIPGLTIFTHGRVINSINYLYMIDYAYDVGTVALLIPDYDSVS